MKRDMVLIREILLKLESYPTDDEIKNIELKDYSPEEIIYHIYLLNDAGLICAEILHGLGTKAPTGYNIFGVTWAGHEFLDACREKGRWEKAMKIAGEMSSISFDILKLTLTQLMTKDLCKFIG